MPAINRTEENTRAFIRWRHKNCVLSVMHAAIILTQDHKPTLQSRKGVAPVTHLTVA